jgi:hypothetical protein
VGTRAMLCHATSLASPRIKDALQPNTSICPHLKVTSFDISIHNISSNSAELQITHNFINRRDVKNSKQNDTCEDDCVRTENDFLIIYF